jgi:hypothetical protein
MQATKGEMLGDVFYMQSKQRQKGAVVLVESL